MNSITATYGAYVITKAENGTITVAKDGEVCANTAQALRDIAQEAGFEIDPAWNTRTAGAKSIKFLLSDDKEPSAESFYGHSLMRWLKEVCIIETEDDVFFDAESADQDDVELFINNLKAQNMRSENQLMEKLTFDTVDDFISYLDNDDDELLLAQKMVVAAYCTNQGIEIDDDTELYEDEQLYYINDCRGVHYEYSTDIDLG